MNVNAVRPGDTKVAVVGLDQPNAAIRVTCAAWRLGGEVERVKWDLGAVAERDGRI